MPYVVSEIEWDSQPPYLTGVDTSVAGDYAFNAAVFPINQAAVEVLSQSHSSLFVKLGIKTMPCADFTAHAAAGLYSTQSVHLCEPKKLIAYFRPTSANGYIFSAINTAGTTSAYAGMWGIRKSGSSLIFTYNDGTGSIKDWTVANVTLAADTDTLVVFDVKESSIECCESGVLKDTLAWTMPAIGANTLAFTKQRVGRSGTGFDGFSGYLYLAAAVDNLDVKSASLNPWPIFEPEEEFVYFTAGGTTINADHILNLDWLLKTNSDSAAPVEYRAALNADAQAPFDFSAAVQTSAVIPFDSGLAVRADHVTPCEWLAAVQADAVVPVEWSGGVLVNADAEIPVEWLGSVNADGVMPVSFSQLLAVDRAIPVAFGAGVVSDQAAVLEWLASIGADALLPLSTIAVVQGDQVIMAEWSGTAAFVNGNLNIFHLDERGTVWRIDARGTVWNLDSRGTVWRATKH